MLRTFISLIILLSTTFCLAQIGGVTGSKINSVNHMPIDVGRAEFEPTYNLARYSQFWDNEGKVQDVFASPDSVVIDASINLRMAYTITTNLEFGCNLGNDYSNWSAKYAIGTYNKLGVGLLAGANFPFGYAEFDRKNRTADQIGTYGMGLILSYETSEKSSIDFNAQYQGYFHKNENLPNGDYFVSIDYGHYVGDLFWLASFLYQNSPHDLFNQNKLTFSPGVSIEMKPEYLMVFNFNFDLFGKNIEKTSGLGLSFTLTL